MHQIGHIKEHISEVKFLDDSYKLDEILDKVNELLEKRIKKPTEEMICMIKDHKFFARSKRESAEGQPIIDSTKLKIITSHLKEFNNNFNQDKTQENDKILDSKCSENVYWYAMDLQEALYLEVDNRVKNA